MKIDRAETLRYLRMGGVEPDAVLARRLARVEDEVRAACRPAAYWRLETVAAGTEAGDLVLGPLEVRSRDLARVLRGCRHAFLFCATLGAGVDALLRRYSQTSGADALMAQAAATVAIEGWCDACAEKLLAESAVAGERLRMRFSPGYGDLPLAVQRPLLQILDSARRAGIVLTETCLMIPSKSVSAIIGVGPEPAAPCPAGCRACSKTECEYRTC
ncbi:MAG: vitamin B12 dependent-methionine synthase activation domain-containing protein [bacterium]|nr:vitamin B12 dependent-methionine synthase activation domain-containing protein [bacterium]